MSWRFRTELPVKLHPFRLSNCEGCGRCAAACPVAEAMDFTPVQVVQMALTGQAERAARTAAPWICTDCRACDDVCPQGVRVAGFLNSLRQDCILEQRDDEMPVQVEMAAGFHRAFTATCRDVGRVGHWGTFLRYRFETFDFFSNLHIGLRWLLAGRLSIRPRLPWYALRRVFNRLDERRQRLLDEVAAAEVAQEETAASLPETQAAVDPSTSASDPEETLPPEPSTETDGDSALKNEVE